MRNTSAHWLHLATADHSTKVLIDDITDDIEAGSVYTGGDRATTAARKIAVPCHCVAGA